MDVIDRNEILARSSVVYGEERLKNPISCSSVRPEGSGRDISFDAEADVCRVMIGKESV